MMILDNDSESFEERIFEREKIVSEKERKNS